MFMWDNLVNPPARKLESVFRFVEDRADIVDAHDCCAKFLEICAGAFSDKSGQCRLATARWAPQNDAAQGTFVNKGGEERIRPNQMGLADKIVQRVGP